MHRSRFFLCVGAFCTLGLAFGQTAAPVPVVPESEAWRHVLAHPKPLYPAIAKSAHITGQVQIATEVDPSGTVTKTVLISGPPLLRQAALDAVKSWRFTRFVLEGVAVTVHTKMTISYTATGVLEPGVQ